MHETPDGRVIWLETGNKKAGLEHIMDHEIEFAKKGIAIEDVPDLVFDAIASNNIVGYQRKTDTGRPIYRIDYNGKLLDIAITVGDNGYIIGANMRPTPKKGGKQSETN